MKRLPLLLLLFTSLSLVFFSCSRETASEPKPAAETGMYIGIIGFNKDLNEKELSLIDANNKYEFTSFVSSLSSDNGTVLYHAVNAGLDNLAKANLPNDVINVSIITFTDGLDLGSYALNHDYDSGDEYLAAIKSRISSDKIKDLNINAYAIGVKGDDVHDNAKFYENISNLSSSSENAMNVDNMNQVTTKFQEIAESLTSTNSTQTLELKLPVPEPNTTIRFTFDNVSDANQSNVYIEGVYSNTSGTQLTEINYHGLKSESGTTVTGTLDGVELSLTFSNLLTTSDQSVSTYNLKQWSKTSTGAWQVNSEFNPSDNTSTKLVRNGTAVVMLVLDCSSSLGSDFSSMKSAASNFIDVLVSGTSSNGGGGNYQTQNINSLSDMDYYTDWNYDSYNNYFYSTNQTDYSSGYVYFTANHSGTLSFDYKTSTESSDKLKLYINDNYINYWSGTSSYFYNYTYSVNEGDVIKFMYYKDGSISSGDDKVYVKNIKVE